MNELLLFVLLGMAVGAVYALTAQGLVLIYRASGVVNFAQGAYGMVGAFLFYKLQSDLDVSQPVAWLVAIGVPVLLGMATHAFVMANLSRASSLMRLAATLGVMFLLIAAAHGFWGRGSEPVLSPLPQTLRRPFGGDSAITEDRLWIIGIAVAVTAVLSALFRWTAFGRATEAVAENPSAASALGISPHRIALVNWGLGAGLAGVAAVLVAPVLQLHVEALAFIVLRSLAAALVGRFRSFWRTLIGALAIGVVESLLSRYIRDAGLLESVVSSDGLLFGVFSAQATSRSAAFLIIVVVLVVAGRGLPIRGELADRLPLLGTGRISLPWLAVGAVLVGLFLVVGEANWVTGLTVSAAYAIICLSVIVVSGFTGQLSLAQMALAGFGAWVAGRLVQLWSLPFLPALLIGVLVTIPLGVIMALPALRTRGANLALLTFGLAVVIAELVLQNAALTGGLEGTIIGRLDVLGWSVDAFDHPERYAVIVLLALLLAGLAVANLRRGGTGLRLIAVRSNERAAASLGVSVYEVKLYAFGVAAALAALGGILLAFRERTIIYENFSAFASIEIVVYAVIGGIGFTTGSLYAGIFASGGLGAEVFELFGFDVSTLDLVSGIVLLATILANPSGLAHGNAVIAEHLLGRGRAQRDPDVPSGSRPPAPRPEGGEPVQDPDVPPADGERAPVLRVTDVTVRFGGVVAVDRLDLLVRPGEIVGLIGPNGAGKTTVIDALTGMVKPDSGAKVEVAGQELSGRSAAQRARAGLGRSFQSLELFDDLTVRENLAVACDPASRRRYAVDLVRPSVPVLSADAVRAVRAFDLESVLDAKPEELSYGRRRLVAIARAVAAAPQVLLLDEPAAGLGERDTAELGALVQELARSREMGVLLVEHDMSMVMSICDRLVVLDHGETIATGPTALVARDPRVVAAYLGTPPEDVVEGSVAEPVRTGRP